MQIDKECIKLKFQMSPQCRCLRQELEDSSSNEQSLTKSVKNIFLMSRFIYFLPYQENVFQPYIFWLEILLAKGQCRTKPMLKIKRETLFQISVSNKLAMPRKNCQHYLLFDSKIPN